MKTGSFKIALIAVILLTTMVLTVRASGPAGCYAIVEKVVLEPNDKAPERVQVWGVFALNDSKPGLGYLTPQRGYLYFRLPPEDQTQLSGGSRSSSRPIALAEWNDLKSVAGSGKAVAFAERTTGPGPSGPMYWTARIRPVVEPPTAPEVYPIYNGITAISAFSLPDADLTNIVTKLKEALKTK